MGRPPYRGSTFEIECFQFAMAVHSNLDTVPAFCPRHRAGIHGQQETVRDQGDHEPVQRSPGGFQCLLPAWLLEVRLGLVLQLG